MSGFLPDAICGGWERESFYVVSCGRSHITGGLSKLTVYKVNKKESYFRIPGHLKECFKERSINTKVSFFIQRDANKGPGKFSPNSDSRCEFYWNQGQTQLLSSALRRLRKTELPDSPVAGERRHGGGVGGKISFVD